MTFARQRIATFKAGRRAFDLLFHSDSGYSRAHHVDLHKINSDVGL